jgi:hypothetical protein
MIQGALIFLLFLAPTVQYRVELGGVSFALLEPVILLVSSLLLAHQIVSWRRLVILKEPLVYFFSFIVLWALVIRPWADDWKHGLSDVRDWAIPLLGFVALVTTIRQGWRRWIAIFLLLVWLNALVGIYQHLTDSFRPFVSSLAAYKTGFTVSPEDISRLALVSYAAGFFTHPNGFAMYLFAGLMLGLGQLAGSRKWWLGLGLVMPIALALFWTYAKASLLVMGAAVVIFWLQRWIKPGTDFLVILIFGLVTGAIMLWLAIPYVPSALLTTFWWRVGLWQTGLSVIGEYPAILFSGNGLDIFAQQAYYGQPHNLYLYLLLEYGLPGLLWSLLLGWHLLRRGWRARQLGLLRAEPLLAALWVTLLGYFAIGLVESNLLGIENRMIFLTIGACFVGLSREVRAKTSIAVEAERKPYAREAFARPRPI